MPTYNSDRTGAELDLTLDDADTHHANVANPHSVTMAQVTGGAEAEAINFRITPAVMVEESGANEIDLASNGIRTLTLTTNAIFTTLNRAPGRQVVLSITNDASADATLTFPAWKFMNASGEPATLTAFKEALLSLTCLGTTDEDIRAVWIEEP
jgi:hypothetical protein